MSETAQKNDALAEVIPLRQDRLWKCFDHPSEQGQFIGFALDDYGDEFATTGGDRGRIEDRLALFKRQYETRDLFLDAWKRGIELVGPELFFVESPTVQEATSKNQLTPNWDLINKDLLNRSGTEAAFLASMCSFYNSKWGAELVAKTDRENSICGITFNMDSDRRQVLADLIVGYRGW